MTDADFQAKLERALTWAGIWSAGQKCIAERTRLRFITAKTPRCHHAQYKNYEYDGTLVIEPHDIPCPLLTDELAMVMLDKLEAGGFQYQLLYDGELACLDCWPPGTIKRRIDGSWTKLKREAIVLAVAALAEAKQGKQG